MIRSKKATTRKGKLVIESKMPKMHENVKRAVLMTGSKSSGVLNSLLADWHKLSKQAKGGEADSALRLTRKHEGLHPIEAGGEAPLEQLSRQTDCSLFVVASHSKKRPHNLTLARMFNHQLFDMLEIGVTNYADMAALKAGGRFAPQVGSKPCFAFIGSDFDTDLKAVQLKSLLLDFFRGEVVKTIDLAGLDRVFICAAHNGKVLLRHCAIRLKRSSSSTPRVSLVPIGPNIDFELRRDRQPGEELWKEAMRRAEQKERKQKNVTSDATMGKTGRIYMPSQPVATMALAKMKGLKRERRQGAAERKQKKHRGKEDPGGEE